MTGSPHPLVHAGIAVIAFAVGALVGIVTTFAHRQVPPFGLLAGLLIIAALLVGARLAFPGRLPAAAAGLGVVASVAILSLQTTGGSVLVANDPLGLVWAIGPTLIAVVVVAWPRPRVRPEAASDSE